MANVAMTLMPGASAALIDWDGSEVARLRSFGLMHGVLLRDLPSDAQARLLTRLRDGEEPAVTRSGAAASRGARGSERMASLRRHPVAASSSVMARGK